ncbi:hypothetical protein SCLCIDRAFT_28295 [Scleroderma citrinum Foug A]|uniref:CCHC-type domain-containing protein n=1 Tax=Scleroderma citrinum Foug A TaxID=1036808 RepID=A0A0C3DBR1_9AGAM|nr:hypothetical protein SCLCIDRAFT_28295 [Scleroderma citrinum Foug A]
MANWDDIILQLANRQQALHNTLQQYIAMQVAGGAAHPKKIVPVPELYNGSPHKFHKWWSKTKVWVATTHAAASDREKAAAVFLHLEGPRAGHYTQVHLNECMATNTWPMWADLQMEIENFFLLGNNQEIDDFLAQFQALKVQSACPNEYAKDLLERAVQRKVLEQVYMRGLPRETWEQVVGAVRTVGRAQELFLINMATLTRYFGTNNYLTSSSTPSGSSAPMDIGAANTCPQPCGKGLQCYNCQGFGHITQKTHKKIATVSSPLSVLPNKYASLVVEDVDTQCTMDCVDTTTSFVSPSTVLSTGVPRSGPAPDVKGGVLNSHVLINGQNSPSLASSDSESPADDLEVVEALLDSSATGCFVDKSWALDRCLHLSKLVKPVSVLIVDGTRNQEDDTMHYVLLTVGVGKHAEKLWCAVTCLGKVPLILGHDWLKKHNPDIDWTTGDVKLSRCPPECKSLMDTRFAKLILDNESQETWIQALKNHKSKGDIDESTLEEAQKLVPRKLEST